MDIIASELRFPEGPIAMPDGSFLVVEIAGKTLTRIDAQGRKSVIAMLGGGPNGAAIGPDGACYVCNNGGLGWHSDPDQGLRPAGTPADYDGGRIERIDLTTGEVTRLYDRAGDHLLSGPNDIVFDRHGGFWFTDLGKFRPRSADHGGVYYATVDGASIREVIYPMSSANGIGLSRDETRLYVAETAGARIWEFELSAPGEVVRQPFPSPNGGRMLFVSPRFQRFDSLAIDADGNICVAAIFEGMILVISPTGEEIAALPMPDVFPTNICFGGADLQTAYITLSGHGLLVALPWPRPGLPLNFLND
ncbi:SMP-30/gluconolactonase/LRE family protein (plasmid) [Sphingomonas paeninsulae]|uniref:SMP-30/gluconolactonase/LRE family protein n=1 Tax=Sphingomonas paeninsulae TaxID=2319844 RepID=A0A494T6B3_SPHPE|nr:SMP-30/gluconolactonase/LRE family protein [Sphingomonas paeninsulae]AYJ84877.1 SMP-30/gluconolactonase/LRE family protein [Sphingomonas paeninsulae]